MDGVVEMEFAPRDAMDSRSAGVHMLIMEMASGVFGKIVATIEVSLNFTILIMKEF